MVCWPSWVILLSVFLGTSLVGCLKDLHMVTLLSDDDFHLPSLNKVRPAIVLAARKVAAQKLLPGFRIHLSFYDSHCSNVYAPYSAFEAYKHNKVHVFFGPSCDFALGKLNATK